MKIKGISWIGVLTDDYDGTKDFWGKVLGLNQEWTDNDKNITFYRFPSGQEVEVYSSTNRPRKEKIQALQRTRPGN